MSNQFKAGNTYSMRSVCDHNCIWTYEVVRRTAKSVWLKDSKGDVKRCVVSVYDGAEHVMPKGRYSMAPILVAA
jgi:hypothetical protein